MDQNGQKPVGMKRDGMKRDGLVRPSSLSLFISRVKSFRGFDGDV